MNFDRVATIYDATRGLPPDVAERLADAIVAVTHAQPATRFLELGIGTGRIAAPLIARGYPFTGVDISADMVERLREKVGNPPNLTLIQGDVTHLPLPDVAVDVTLVIHVFHLIPEWQVAMAEMRRVLAPGGYFVWGGNNLGDQDPGSVIRRQWAAFAEEAGADLRPRYGNWKKIHEEVTRQGGLTATYEAVQWTVTFRPIDLLEAIRRRTFSASWSVSEDVLETAHQKLLEWGREYFGDLASPVENTETFTLFVTRFPQ